nr:hypothetical protein [Tanacetum cinerariifolium]
MGTIDSMKYVLTQSALDALCKKYFIPDAVHPQLPGPNDRIHNSPIGQIAAKVSHFEILCRVHNFEPTVGNFRRNKTLKKDPPPLPTEYNTNMDLFAFIQHADPTMARIREKEVREGKVPLFELTRGRVIPLAGVNDQGGADVQGAGDDNALVADKPKKARTRKINDGASGSGLPPRDLLDKSSLAVEIGVTVATTVPFVTSYVTPTPKHEGGGHADFVSTANLQTKPPAERFVISSNTPHDSSANAADDKVSLVVRSIVLDPAVLTTTIATTVVAGTSILFPRGGDEPTCSSIFVDSTSAGMVGPDVARPSQPADTDPTTDSFYLRAMGYDQLLIEFNVGAARKMCLGAEVRVRLEHVRREKKRLEGRCATRSGELESLKERDVALKGRVTALDFATVAKDFEVAKLTWELSSLRLSCDDLRIKDSTCECEKDKIIDQVKALSGRVASIDSDLMDMAFHMDEEFYPCYLTTVARRRWILGRDLKLAVIKCLQLPKYPSVLGGALGHAIDKGMQDGLVAGVDHGRAERDASMADIMDLLRLKGPAAETPEAIQLQPSPEQLMDPINRLEDQVIIRETSLSFSLDVAHVHAQRIKGDTAARRLSLTDAMVPLLEPLSAKSLTGKASTYGFLITTTALSTMFF